MWSSVPFALSVPSAQFAPGPGLLGGAPVLYSVVFCVNSIATKCAPSPTPPLFFLFIFLFYFLQLQLNVGRSWMYVLFFYFETLYFM